MDHYLDVDNENYIFDKWLLVYNSYCIMSVNVKGKKSLKNGLSKFLFILVIKSKNIVY